MLTKEHIENLKCGDALETRSACEFIYGGLNPVTKKPMIFDRAGKQILRYNNDLSNVIESALDIVSIWRTDRMREFEEFAKGKEISRKSGNRNVTPKFCKFDYWIEKNVFKDKGGFWQYRITENWREEWEEYVEEEYVPYTNDTFDRTKWFVRKSDIEDLEFPIQAYMPKTGKIMIRGIWYTFKEFFEKYTHTDSTPAGVKK